MDHRRPGGVRGARRRSRGAPGSPLRPERDSRMSLPERVLVVMPTYDERENLPGALERLRTHVPAADVLVVDDGSPDGTGELAEKIADREASELGTRRVHVLHRAGKLGLGTAYVTGFGWALERGYDVVVEMDADGSHRAEDLPRLLAKM